MVSKKEFEFLNSDLWLKYTQDRYVPLSDIRYRLDKLGISASDWPMVKKQVQTFRKMSAIPFFFDSLDKKFWYFPSDSISKKLHKVESAGNRLYDLIENHSPFKKEFFTNATIEEAITSAIYEGANTTRAEAKALIATGKKPKDKDEYMPINNYKAMKWIKENAKFPITNESVLKIHEIISANTLEGDDASFCGKFRNDTVYIGNHEGISHTKIEESLKEAIRLTTNHPRFLHTLIKGILLHYFIAYIHPFFDGNGRTARTFFYVQAIQNNLKFVELLSISADLKEHGKRYERSFDLVKEHEYDMTFFIDFCLDSLITAVQKVEIKINYLKSIADFIETEGINENQVSLLQRMAINKFSAISIEKYAEDIGKSREIARQELKDLTGKDFLREMKQGKKYAYYIQSKNIKKKIFSKS